MDIKFSSKKHQNFHLNSLLSIILFLPSVLSDYTDLVYRGCADQNFPSPSQPYAQNLKTLFNSLLTQSSKTNFSKTTIGEGTQSAIFGLYQCRGDLTAIDCNNCVSKFPKMARKYCGENSIAARIQLVGCTVRYEVVGFPEISSTDLLYKVCKGGSVVTGGGFEARRDSGFEEVETGIGSGSGFYAASYGSVYVMGQCEGDLGGSDCGDCVKTALERVKAECGDSMSGQVYLNQCYVSYSYYPNGVGDEKTSSPGKKQGTAKTVAIVVGGTAAAGFLVAILLCLKSILKKKPKKYQYGG
ncbi:plasmodesmata-located protein 3-like [Silene latifolia]|uniref:plasmodesmata-located protein 3-like n=1 Tax=Silene latifolia TaxID=37657 RepID=UPI003D776BFF